MLLYLWPAQLALACIFQAFLTDSLVTDEMHILEPSIYSHLLSLLLACAHTPEECAHKAQGSH